MNWKKCLLSLLCAAAIVLGISLSGAQAAEGKITILALNDQVITPISSTNMPIQVGGTYYLPYTVFDPNVVDVDLGVKYSLRDNVLTLYTKQALLKYDLNAGTCEDRDGSTGYTRAIVRGSYVFFPVDLIADVFDLTFTYLRVDPAPVIRLKNSSARLSDTVFLDAASGLMNERYRTYLASLAPAPSTEPETPDTSEEPETPPPTVYGGQRVYLIFTVTDTESAQRLLATLNAAGKQAAFLFSEEQLQSGGDLVRAVVGGGHAVGFLVDDRDAAGQLERCGDLLWEAARVSTRLVWLEESQSALAAGLEEAGYCVMDCRLDYSGAPLTSASRASTLYARISSLNISDLPVFLGQDRENTAGLSRLLTSLDSSDCRVIAYRETL